MAMRLAVGTVVVVGVLVGGAYAADGVARGQAEGRVADRVEAGFALDVTPEVDAHGFPFLLQVARGELEDVAVVTEQATFGGMALHDVDVRLRNVTTTPPHVAQDVEMSARIPMSQVQDAVGIDVPLGTDGEHLVATIQVLTLEVEVVLRLEATGREVRVGIDGMRAAGADVDPARIPGLGDLDGRTFPVDGLPEGLELTGLDVQEDGVVLHAAGAEVQLESLE